MEPVTGSVRTPVVWMVPKIGPAALSDVAPSVPMARFDWIRFDPDGSGGGGNQGVVDEFDGTELGNAWERIRGDQSAVVNGGTLQIPAQPGDIYQTRNDAKNLVGEAEAMSTLPDAAMTKMADQLATGTSRLDEALREFAAGRRDAATQIADRAVKDQRHIQHTYRKAISALLDDEDLREVTARRELYRRFARTGDELVRVAERIWYSVLKED